jgi:hypothetical protein
MSRKNKKQDSSFVSTDGDSQSSKQKHRKKIKELDSLPPRTSKYDKKAKKQISGAEKVQETAHSTTYQWTEDTGGDKVKVKRREYMKEHSTPMTEEDWISINGSTCKINREKFDKNYEDIFGKKKRGVLGEFKKFKKTY